ncbi:MAG: transcription termination/antitermination protein NusA [Bacteroidaceae bacterium]|nr:transcription termination/antitermination protein NusA [Bacteroidaceae bacterium]
MATKNQTNQISLVDTFAEFKETKNIDRPTLVSVLEESFRGAIAKMFGSDENYSVIVNPDKGDFEIYRDRVVVADGEVKDPNKEVSLSEAHEIDEDFEVGEELTESIDFAKFGRRAILTLRQTLASKILDLEHDNLYNEYKDKVGTIVSGEVHNVWKNETLILDENDRELILPKKEQIPGDFFRKGDIVRAVVARVDNTSGVPKIILSRTSPIFLQRLLENEVPELADGLIAIKKISRLPGRRAKIAVESYDDRIDPVGACVGVKGSRVHGIVRELRGENLDVIPWTSNLELLISRTLQPAHINKISIDNENRHVDVYLDPDQVSLAIGNGGANIKLASLLTEMTIDVFRELQEGEGENDVNLDEFADDIEPWIIEQLKGIGLTTARNVLDAPRELLIEQADLEEETVDEVLAILREELEEDEETE